MRRQRLGIVIGLILTLAVSAGPAWAKDKVLAAVTSTSPAAVVTPNGMAVGTIHVLFTLDASGVTPGEEIGTFSLALAIGEGGGNPTSYGTGLTINLSQKQEGDENLILIPGQSAFDDVYDASWTNGGGTMVTVRLPEILPEEDGATLTGSLQLEGGSQLNTNTSILVKVVLLQPTACLKVATFVTDTEFRSFDSATVNLKTDKKTGVTTLNSTNPGQFSDNVLVVNSCGSDQEIDLRIQLDSCFDTNPSGNPGQAVFTYLAEGEIDVESFEIGAFGTGAAQGQSLCLSGLTVPNGQTLLATVHMGAIKGLPASSLPADSSFDFAAAVYEIGSNGCSNGLFSVLADPEPATVAVPFTTTK